MSAEWVRNHYGVPAKRGGRINLFGKDATIVGFKAQYLRVRVDGSDKILTAHPTWEIEYMPEGDKNGAGTS